MQTLIWKSISTIHKINKYFKVYHFSFVALAPQNSTTIYEFLKGKKLSTEVNNIKNQYKKASTKRF